MSLSGVYFIQAGLHLGPIKIGLARNVSQRIRELQTGNPARLYLLGLTYARGYEASRLERELHRRFAPLRLSGEWFRAAPMLFEEIEKCPLNALTYPAEQYRLMLADPNHVPVGHRFEREDSGLH